MFLKARHLGKKIFFFKRFSFSKYFKKSCDICWKWRENHLQNCGNIISNSKEIFSLLTFRWFYQHLIYCQLLRAQTPKAQKIQRSRLGGNSQNFLQKFVRFFITLGLKILKLLKLRVVFEAYINKSYC